MNGNSTQEADNGDGPIPLLLHVHIFKNSGSTLDWILRRNFGARFAELHGANRDSTLQDRDVEVFIRSNPHVDVLSSHHLRFPLKFDIGRQVIPLVLIRHPIDRVASMFEHDRRQVGIDPNEPKFQSLKVWVQEALKNSRYLICDSQTMFLSAGGTYYDAPTIIEFGDAMSILNDLPYCGVVDNFEQSMVVLEDLIGRWMPKFAAEYFPQNVSRGRSHVLKNRLDVIETELGDELFKHLVMENHYDTMLYEAAREKLKGALESVPDWQKCLIDLRGRNESLC